MKNIILAALFSVLLSSCSSETESEQITLPEVNDFNCKYEQIIKLKTKEIQQEFSSLCLRRSSSSSSSNKSWGDTDF